MADTSVVWPEELRKRWASIFKIFYHMDPQLDNRGPESLTQEAEEIVQVAMDLRATPSAFQRIETELLNFNQMTFHSIVTNPVPWSNIGKRIHSSTIYQEAVIHLVGRWNSIMTEPYIETLAPATHQLCEKKHQELVLRKKTIECHMLSYYPESMHRGGSSRSSSGSGSGSADDGDLSCASYASDIYTWMALAFFRQWFSHALLDCRNYVSADGGAFLYRVIGAGADSYLDAREQAFFNLAFPMSVKGREVFEEKLREVKVDMQGFVEELLVNRSRYCFAEVPYLTCCQVDREDLPWDDALDAAKAEVEADADDSTWFLKSEKSEIPDPEMHKLLCYDHGSSSGSGSSIHTSTAASLIGTPDFNTEMGMGMGMGVYSTFSPMPLQTLQSPFKPCAGGNSSEQQEKEEQQGNKFPSGNGVNILDQMNPYDTRFGWINPYQH